MGHGPMGLGIVASANGICRGDYSEALLIVALDKIRGMLQGRALTCRERRREMVREPFLVALLDEMSAHDSCITQHFLKDSEFVLHSAEVRVVLLSLMFFILRGSSMLFQLSLHSRNVVRNDMDGSISVLEAIAHVVVDGSGFTTMPGTPFILATVA